MKRLVGLGGQKELEVKELFDLLFMKKILLVMYPRIKSQKLFGILIH